MKCVSSYKYLGCWVNEFGSNEMTVEALTSATSRSYGRIKGIVKNIGDMGHSSFMSLYDSYIMSVADSAAGVWRFKDYSALRVLQNKIAQFYHGVHRLAPVPATNIEMSIPNIQFHRWLELVRYHNRIVNLTEH